MYFIVVEYVGGGDLLSYVKTQREQRLTELQAWHYTRQLLSALNYLHSKNVVHRFFQFSECKVYLTQLMYCTMGKMR